MYDHCSVTYHTFLGENVSPALVSASHITLMVAQDPSLRVPHHDISHCNKEEAQPLQVVKRGLKAKHSLVLQEATLLQGAVKPTI